MYRLGKFRQLASVGRPRTLFAWLLTCFILVLLPLVSFTLFSLIFFSERAKDEVIRYNEHILAASTVDYEKQFRLITDSVLVFSMGLKLQELNAEPINYPEASRMRNTIQTFINNSSLGIENLILYFGGSDFVLDKTKGSSSEDFFRRYLYHSEYDITFWQSLFASREQAIHLPTTTFAEFDTNGNLLANFTQMPIVIRNKLTPDFYIIALIDADSMYESYSRSINDNFYISDSQGRLLYSHANADPNVNLSLSKLSYEYIDRNHRFLQTGSFTGLSYLAVIPDTIMMERNRMNGLLGVLLVVIVVISVAVSFIFSFRLRSPVKRMIQTLVGHETVGGLPTTIKEFSEIQEQVKRIIQSNQDIHLAMRSQTSLLQQYALIDKFKKRRNKPGLAHEALPESMPFRIVLFQIHYLTNLQSELGFTQEHASPYLKEFIENHLKAAFPESITFQVESRLVLSIVYGNAVREDVFAIINEIADLMENEGSYCYLTIAVGQSRTETGVLTDAYDAAESLLQLRQFDAPNQVIVEPGPVVDSAPFSIANEEEFERHLQGDNNHLALQIIEKTIRTMKKKNATHLQVMAFSNNLALRIDAGCSRLNLDTGQLRKLSAQLADCHTYEQLTRWFEQLLKIAAALYESQKKKRDPIIAFVSEYIESHYDSVISLDLLADKLDISRSYLSTYFKEKTGMYFVDYVNSIRVSKVIPLLVQPGAKVQEVAAQVGFQSINTFNRTFKKITGYTPSQYRLNAIVDPNPGGRHRPENDDE